MDSTCLTRLVQVVRGGVAVGEEQDEGSDLTRVDLCDLVEGVVPVGVGAQLGGCVVDIPGRCGVEVGAEGESQIGSVDHGVAEDRLGCGPELDDARFDTRVDQRREEGINRNTDVGLVRAHRTRLVQHQDRLTTGVGHICLRWLRYEHDAT